MKQYIVNNVKFYILRIGVGDKIKMTIFDQQEKQLGGQRILKHAEGKWSNRIGICN